MTDATYKMYPKHPLVRVILHDLRVTMKKDLNKEEISREIFTCNFSSAVHWLFLSDNDVAKIFQISRPTVKRWFDGETAPHPIGRKPVLNHLLKLIEEKLGINENT